ncbi:MAG: GDP-mannose 4,6-dehydratase [Candidatus Helarchaeota archaeon]
MKLKDNKILITGGAGFIGSNLADHFLENENEVTVIDNLDTGTLKNIENAKKNKNFNFIKGDIRNENLLKSLIKDCEYLFHHAAIASVPFSIDNPIETNDVNVNGTLNILNLVKESDVKRLVFASSSAVYGELETIPIKEDMPTNPISPYGVTKLAAEYYLDSFYKIYGLKVSSIRYFNVFGMRQADSPYSGVIPIWFGKILKNEPPVIFGNGNQIRDFIYIKDIIRLNELCALKQSAIGEVFNGATAISTNINELAKMILNITNKELTPIIEEERQGDIKKSLADISKAQELLGFQPKYRIQDGLKEFYSYLMNKK